MYEDFFAERLSALRNQKNISAREMSLAIGQNPSYINRIENKQAFPSMQAFFYICEYLSITPKDFFDTDAASPAKRNEIIEELYTLDDSQLQAVAAVIQSLKQGRKQTT
ncbi:MAG: helix-turn-helix transcriptional regulator [Firmicutes bacterium]|jgi:transcriptional regulator with XRE-family HTH domain|nr:helix-turn-helix transcriptional regulator [Bacillota bacterium]